LPRARTPQFKSFGSVQKPHVVPEPGEELRNLGFKILLPAQSSPPPPPRPMLVLEPHLTGNVTFSLAPLHDDHVTPLTTCPIILTPNGCFRPCVRRELRFYNGRCFWRFFPPGPSVMSPPPPCIVGEDSSVPRYFPSFLVSIFHPAAPPVFLSAPHRLPRLPEKGVFFFFHNAAHSRLPVASVPGPYWPERVSAVSL